MRATQSLQSTRHGGHPEKCAYGLVTRRSLVCSLALVALGTLLPSSDAVAATAAEAFVRTNIDKSYAILNGDDDGSRQAAFRVLLESIVDTKRVALFTLGPYAREVSQADLAIFMVQFTDLLAYVYERGLDTYKGRTLEVIGSSERSPGDFIVNVVVGGRSQAASNVHIDFRVRRQPDGGNAITDLQVEGVWLALMQREEFIAYLQQHHGSITDLSSEVKRKVEQLRSASKSAATSS